MSSAEQVRGGSALATTAGTTMFSIVDAVERMSTIIGEISDASQAQTASIEQVNASVSEIDETTRQNATLVGDATTAAASLEKQAAVLVNSVAAFRLTGGSIESTARPAHAA